MLISTVNASGAAGGFFLACKIRENWTIGPIVAMTPVDQLTQSLLHFQELEQLLIDLRKMIQRNRLDIGARTTGIRI